MCVGVWVCGVGGWVCHVLHRIPVTPVIIMMSNIRY